MSWGKPDAFRSGPETRGGVLKHLDLLIVRNIFLTETAQFADVVLSLPPASRKKDGTFTNTERRVRGCARPFSVPGSAKADWEIIAELATRLGYPMPYASAGEIMTEINRVTPSYAGNHL